MTDNVRAHLLAIRDQRGTLTAETVVAAARPADHPLHHRFEWDNKIAGHKYRLVQAADLIRSVHITEVTDDRTERVRAFVSVPTTDGRRYEPAEEVANDDITRTLVLREMQRDWLNLKKRYEAHREFFAMISNDVGAA